MANTLIEYSDWFDIYEPKLTSKRRAFEKDEKFIWSEMDDATIISGFATLNVVNYLISDTPRPHDITVWDEDYHTIDDDGDIIVLEKEDE